MEVEEEEWVGHETDKECPECHSPVVAMVNNNHVDFFMCTSCKFSYGGDVHGTKQ